MLLVTVLFIFFVKKIMYWLALSHGWPIYSVAVVAVVTVVLFIMFLNFSSRHMLSRNSKNSRPVSTIVKNASLFSAQAALIGALVSIPIVCLIFWIRGYSISGNFFILPVFVAIGVYILIKTIVP
jgi:hypothetical protein